MTLTDIQERPEKIIGLGLTTLAKLAHAAEDEGDEISFFAILREVERFGRTSERIFYSEYNRLMRERLNQP